MTALLRQREQRNFGSLKDALSKADKDRSALLVSENTEHRSSAIGSRQGFQLHSEVACQSAPFCKPVLTSYNDAAGTLTAERRYYIRYTYATAVGETDDLHSTGPLAPSPAEETVVLAAGHNAIRVEVPFHIRGVNVTSHQFVAIPGSDRRYVDFVLESPPVTVCDDTVFDGWLVYSRSPRIQDETALGINCGADEPLYHRRQDKPNGLLGVVESYDSGSGKFRIKSEQKFGMDLFEDDRAIDLMMPDRNGLPIRWFNVYISEDGYNFYHAAVGVDGALSVNVTSHDDTKVLSPARRIDRRPPTLATSEIRELSGEDCTKKVVDTHIEGGLHRVRVGYWYNDPDLLRPAGMTAAQALLSEPADCWPMRCEQQLWPSCSALVCVPEGHAITVTLPFTEWPDHMVKWEVFTERLTDKVGEINFDSSTRNPSPPGSAGPEAIPYAYFSGDNDVSDADIASTYSTSSWKTTYVDAHPNNKKSQTLGAYDQLNTYSVFTTQPQNTPYIACEDTGRGFPPAFEDVTLLHECPDGEYEQAYASTRTTATPGEHFEYQNAHFWFYMDGAADPLFDNDATSHVVFKFRLRLRPGDDGWEPKNGGTLNIRHWDQANSAYVDLETGIEYTDGCFKEYAYCIPFNTGDFYNFANDWQYLILDIWTDGYLGFDIAEMRAELYNEDHCCETPVSATMEGAVRDDDQTGGGDPGVVASAWFSGDDSLTDAQVNTAVTVSAAQLTPPIDARDSVDGYDEFKAADESVLAVYTPGGAVSGLNFDLDDAGTRGAPPSYDDVTFQYDWRCRDSDVGLYASSRDGSAASIANNRMHFWFRQDALPDCDNLKLTVNITYRARAGGSGWSAGTDSSRHLRVWNEADYIANGSRDENWIYLHKNIPSTSNTFVTERYVTPYDPSIRYSFLDTEPDPDETRKYVIVDFVAYDHNGFDIKDIWIEITPESTDPLPTKRELLRWVVDEQDVTTATLKWPQLNKPVVTYDPGPSGQVCSSGEDVQGEWVHVRQNNTGQWPVTCKALPITGNSVESASRLINMVGCADSFFEDVGGGSLERVFQVEGDRHGSVMREDWRFTNYLRRCFALNPGDDRWNYRYDGLATYPMGLGWPASWQDEQDGYVDDSGNYSPPGGDTSTLVDGSISATDDDCLSIGEQPAGTVVDVSGPEGEEGEVPEGEETPIFCHEVEYRFYLARRVTRPNGGYIVRSRPRLLTETVKVCLTEETPAQVRVNFDFCPEEQATHIVVLRNRKNTADYYEIQEFPIDDSIIDDETGRVNLSFNDTIPAADEDLGRRMFLETGRPTAAKIMIFHRGRNWFVQTKEQQVVAFTNVTDAAGAIDPEGFWPFHTWDPPGRDASGITCLAPYHTDITVHTRASITALRGISDAINSRDAIGGTTLLSDAGFVGPDAWCLAANRLIGMSEQGPIIVLGDEAKPFSADVVDFSKHNLDPKWGYQTRMAYHRDGEVTQVVASYTDRAEAHHNAVVYDAEEHNPDIRWKRWIGIPVSDLTVTRDFACGGHYRLHGACNGRTFRYGGSSDYGLPIEFKVKTTWQDEAEISRSIQPKAIQFYLEGEANDYVWARTFQEGVNGERSTNSGRLTHGGYLALADDSCPPPLTKWNEGCWPWCNKFSNWAEANRDWFKQRLSARGFHGRIQVELYFNKEDLPAGVWAGMSFQCMSYEILHRMGGPRSGRTK